MAETSDKSAQEKIIRAAIELVETGDGTEFTVREIVSRAGVNIGAINYYFGSKDELMRRVAKEIMEQFIGGLSSVLDDKSLPPFERLEKALVGLVEMMVSRHRFFRREVFRKEKLFKSKHEMVAYLEGIGIEKLRQTVIELDETLDDTQSFVFALQIFTASVMPNMFYLHREICAPGESRRNDLNMPSAQEQIHGLLARLFPEAC